MASTPVQTTKPAVTVEALRRQLLQERLTLGGVALALALFIAYQNFFPSVWAISVDGKMVVAVRDRGQAEVVLEQLKAEHGGGEDVQFSQDVRVLRIHPSKIEVTNVDGAIRSLRETVRLTSLRGVISVDGVAAAALPTEADANEVIAALKATAAARVTQLDEEPVFVEPVEVATAPADEEIWCDQATALALLGGGSAGEPEFHLVKRGDNPWVIIRRYGMTMREFKQLNPGVKATRLQLGAQLRVRQEAPPAVTIRVKGRLVKEVKTPFETKIRSNPRMYVGKRVETQSGKPGIDRVTMAVVFENDKLVEETVLDRQTVRRPQTKIVVYGSKPRPRR